jgi:hypothetical protein
MPPLMLNGTML